MVRGTIPGGSLIRWPWLNRDRRAPIRCCVGCAALSCIVRHRSCSSAYPWVFLALIVLVAGGLRFFRIDAQSFWNDEGNSARLAERSIDLIVEGARGDIHPPGYYLALKCWRGLFGHSEAALRGLSAVCSAASVVFVFLLGWRLFERAAVGLVAAALVSLNPFEVYYAQEARMYAMLALWATASTWALTAWWQAGDETPERRRWSLAAYVVVAAAGLYTHYAFPLVMLAHSLGVAAWLWCVRRRQNVLRRLRSWVLAQAGVLLLYLPWLPTAWHQVTSWSPPPEAYQFPDVLFDIWRLLNYGHTIPTRAVLSGSVAAACLVILGLLVPAGKDRHVGKFPFRLRWMLLALLVLVPVVVILGTGAYRSAYEKFFLVAAAPLSLLLARGIAGGWRLAWLSAARRKPSVIAASRAVILLLVVSYAADTGRSLDTLFFDETYARADYRGIVRRIDASSRPGDAIILNAPNQWEVFTYYHPDDGHVFPLARQRPFDVRANEAELRQIVSEHQRLFALYWGDAESDPERFIERWLEENTYKAGEAWYGDVRLATYAVPVEVPDTPSVILDARFSLGDGDSGPAILLDGYTLADLALSPGDILQLTLFWRTEDAIADRYKVFVHLYDQAGELRAQTDSEPGATLRPTNTWSPGEWIADHYGVLIPVDAAAGSYTLVVGLYDLIDPTLRLDATENGVHAGDRLDLTQIDVTDRAAPRDE